MTPQTPRFTLFPYTTLFRSLRDVLPTALSTKGFAESPDVRSRTGSLTTAKSFFANPTCASAGPPDGMRSEEHTSELQSHSDLVCRLLLEKKKDLITASLHEL